MSNILDPVGLIGATHDWLAAKDSASSPGGLALQGVVILGHLIAVLILALVLVTLAKGVKRGFAESRTKG